MSDHTKCPNCAAGLVFPRGDAPYCDECGYPDENRLLDDLMSDDCPKALVLRLDPNEPETSPTAYIEPIGDTGSYCWVAVTAELPSVCIGSGNGDDLDEVALNAMSCMRMWEDAQAGK